MASASQADPGGFDSRFLLHTLTGFQPVFFYLEASASQAEPERGRAVSHRARAALRRCAKVLPFPAPRRCKPRLKGNLLSQIAPFARLHLLFPKKLCRANLFWEPYLLQGAVWNRAENSALFLFYACLLEGTKGKCLLGHGACVTMQAPYFETRKQHTVLFARMRFSTSSQKIFAGKSFLGAL